MYVPANAIQSARCPTWEEAARAATFLHDFLTTNANKQPHEWVHYDQDPVDSRHYWYVHTLIRPTDRAVRR